MVYGENACSARWFCAQIAWESVGSPRRRRRSSDVDRAPSPIVFRALGGVGVFPFIRLTYRTRNRKKKRDGGEKKRTITMRVNGGEHRYLAVLSALVVDSGTFSGLFPGEKNTGRVPRPFVGRTFFLPFFPTILLYIDSEKKNCKRINPEFFDLQKYPVNKTAGRFPAEISLDRNYSYPRSSRAPMNVIVTRPQI